MLPLDRTRCFNAECNVRETCRRWTERVTDRLVWQAKCEPGPDGVCADRIATE